MADRTGLLPYEATNAVLGWGLVAILLLATVDRAGAGELLWAGMGLAVVAVSLVPVAVSRRPTAMVAWEVLAFAASPLVARSLGLRVAPMAYLAVAGLALVVAVEADAFTDVEMTPRFAVAFVVVVTMAVAGLWTIARYVSDATLGTAFLTSQNALMWDLVAATALGVAAGVVFEGYFRRFSPGHDLPREPRRAPR